MSSPIRHRQVVTPAGDLTAAVDPGQVWRIGYRPEPWAWIPWQYANPAGRFGGRWDDPAGSFRTIYAGTDLLGCLLEVLAPFRPDPRLDEELARVDEDPDDAGNYPTESLGAVPLSWLTPRAAATASLAGAYCAVTDKGSILTLRQQFLSLAFSFGLADLDAGSLRLSAPRALTQDVAAWLYDLHDGARELFDGVQFESRHGDGLTLWAVFERDRDGDVSGCLKDASPVELRSDDPALLEAFRLHHLAWGNRP